MDEANSLTFPAGFVWGTATSAYQIEGGWDQDGRGVSIWDTFCRQPGKTHGGENGNVAADHYHRWEEDLRLLAELGMPAYRFSIAWPRILPQGKGAPNQAGLDFYERLVDRLLAHAIQPLPTLFHWDLPQALQDGGGWPERATAYHFADYAQVVAERLGDRVTHWLTHNEPLVAAVAGHLSGEHAPGLQDPLAAGQSLHHLLLSHGLAVQALRAHSKLPVQVGITLNLNPVHPASPAEEDQQAAMRLDGFLNRVVLDAILKGSYPQDIQALAPFMFSGVKEGDLAVISTPLEFVGVNYYSRSVVRYDPNTPIINAAFIQPQGSEYSMMWEIYPPGMYELLMRVWQDYRPANIWVTENGIPVPDGIDFDGRVRDERRIRYLHQHIAQVHRAIASGAPVRAYLVWSFLDNFEWALGYQMRFGLVHVDFKTLKRTIKDSGRWFARVIRQNGLPKLPTRSY